MITPRWLVRWLDVPRENPDFPLSIRGAEEEFARMAANPCKGLARPVVVLAGYRALQMMPRGIIRDLRLLTGADNEMFLPVAYPLTTNIPKIAARVNRAVEARWRSNDAIWTREVDVVGVSMGGLVARAAAGEKTRDGEGKRLKIARLFTMGTPHRGAKLAKWLRVDTGARLMRPESEFLGGLDEELKAATYELVCYARLRDTWVGASRTAPAVGSVTRPHWVSGQRVLSHNLITQDRRIIADIARQLRGEGSLAAAPHHPPPCD